ncbi:hypothetical protein Gpo141_00014021 [Globisporangium polare]
MKPRKNNISSRKEFKALCIAERKKHHGFRITEQAIRHLRLTLNATAATTQELAIAISVIFEARALTGQRSVELKHLTEWIGESASDNNGETEFVAHTDLVGEQLYGVRKILGTVRNMEKAEGDSKARVVTYFLVDWKPKLEPRKNISQTLIARFHQEHRTLVRRTFIEDEAALDNSMNPQ